MKRAFDFTVSLALIIILLPVFLLISLIVLIDAGTPVIFRQYRVGKDNKLFYIYKFRTMRKNTRNAATAELTDSDKFITKSGRILRKTSLDELPQLVNILIGNMTFVGPRPPLVTEVERYEPYQKNRLLVKQGLTCYWQCSGRNEIMFDEWVRMDLQYIMERSLWTDFKILLMTIPAVLSGKGAN